MSGVSSLSAPAKISNFAVGALMNLFESPLNQSEG